MIIVVYWLFSRSISKSSATRAKLAAGIAVGRKRHGFGLRCLRSACALLGLRLFLLSAIFLTFSFAFSFPFLTFAFAFAFAFTSARSTRPLAASSLRPVATVTLEDGPTKKYTLLDAIGVSSR